MHKDEQSQRVKLARETDPGVESRFRVPVLHHLRSAATGLVAMKMRPVAAHALSVGLPCLAVVSVLLASLLLFNRPHAPHLVMLSTASVLRISKVTWAAAFLQE